MKMNVSEGAVWVVLADIHANWPALQTVEADAIEEAGKIGVTEDALRYISLGDVVDYGPQPVACLEWVQSKKGRIITILGNHDLEAARFPDAYPLEVGKNHWPLLVWTRCQLTQKQKQKLAQWAPILTDVPGLPDFVLSHSDLGTGKHYWYPCTDPDNVTQVCERFFAPLQANGKHYGLIGHSHQQLLYWFADGHCTLWADERRLLQAWREMPKGYILINPGSVGQPRLVHNGDCLDPRAQYLLLDTRNGQLRYKFRRVSYSLDDTLSCFKMVSLPNPLPNSCHFDPTGALIKLPPRVLSSLYTNLDSQIELLKGLLRNGF